MHNESPTPANENQENASPGETQPAPLTDIRADLDGRNREWEDRARVNLEILPEGTTTNVERDFEPENTDAEKNKNPGPAY